jgi:GT2 family glycosyltransferase
MDLRASFRRLRSGLVVLFYHLAWTARRKGPLEALAYLARRLGLFHRRQPEYGSEANSTAQLTQAARIAVILPLTGDPAALQTSLASLRAQSYPPQQVYLLTFPGEPTVPLPAGMASSPPVRILASPQSHLLDSLESELFTILVPGDALLPDALAQVALADASSPAPGLLYGDERSAPGAHLPGQTLRKPDWSPDFLLGSDYIGRAVFFSRTAVLAAGDWAGDCSRAARYDLALRISENSPRPVRIPHLLLQRSAELPLDDAAGMPAAAEAALQRRGLTGQVSPLAGRPGYQLCRLQPPRGAQVSILIATHDQPELLAHCLDSIFTHTQPPDFEVLLVDHASQRTETRALITEWQQREPQRFRVLAYAGPFNFSHINNLAAAQARGQFLVLLNNDTEVLSPTWLDDLAGYAAQPHAGAVGAVLEYPNGRIQHAGILLGVDDLAVHAFKGLPGDAPGALGRLLVPSNFLAVTGACLMVRAETYQSVGGLCEDFAVAGGDVDFCLRLAQKGLYNIVLPHVRLVHHESATRGFENRYAKFARLQDELDLLRQRWPQYAMQDPYYHPCLDNQGKFTEPV